jgi:hypothetical protein
MMGGRANRAGDSDFSRSSGTCVLSVINPGLGSAKKRRTILGYVRSSLTGLTITMAEDWRSMLRHYNGEIEAG